MSGKSRIEDLYELSPMQQGMLFHSLYDPGSGVYCEQLSCTLTGELEAAAFERAWEQVVERHPALRTAFHWRKLEKPLQAVHRSVQVPWHREDWRGLSAAEQESRLEAWLGDDRRRGFDLGVPPLLRLALFRTGERIHRFVFTFHHILMDGWCLPLVLSEVFTSYAAALRGATARLDRPRPYRDFIGWLQARDPQGDEGYWRAALAGFRAPTPLPYAAAPMPLASAGPEACDEREESLPEAETAALQQLARACQVTVNTLVQAAWALLLARASGEGDVVFGATVSGRPAALPGANSMVGVFINTLPVRTVVPLEAPLAGWLRELQDRQAEAREHEHAPLARIQAWSEVPPGRPLFESILVFENQPLDALRQAPATHSLGVAAVRIAERTNYPLTLVVVPGAAFRLRVIHDRHRLDAGAAARVLAHLRTLLAAMAAAEPGTRLADLPLLTAAERQQLLHEWGAGEPAAGHGCLHRIFEEQARRAPEAAAVTGEDEQLTYRELNRRANRLAHHLRGLGVCPGALVGLCLERSPDLVTAILGTLKAGGAYVPIDPLYPPDRIAYLLEDSRAAVLVTGGRSAVRLPAGQAPVVDLAATVAAPGAEEDLRGDLPPGALAYVIYTSGSTGRPKGVMVTHRNVVRLFTATERWFGFSPDDVWTLFHSYAFDFSVWEIWGALLYGGRVAVVPHWTSRSPEAFLELLGREGVTVLNQTPSAFRQLMRAEEAAAAPLPPLRWVIFGGEALDLPGLAPWFDRHGDRRPRLVNMYGITETTVHVTFRPLSASDAHGGSVVGRALPDLCLRVLDARMEPVPVAVAGEIHVGGAGLARGYLGRPDLTAERFVPDPFAGPGEPGARLYRSGDLARLRPDGDLEYLGRIDHQVKIRGFRIELGEIEAALTAHPAVAEAVAGMRGEGDERRLVAWLVAGGEVPGAEALRAFLKTRLPDHMVPATFLALDALPLTPHGKVDRRALPEPGQERPDLGLDYVAPRTPFEEVLAAIWTQALGLDRVGIDDNFFTLGGDSIRSVRVLALTRAKGLDLSLEEIFGHPTVRELAAVLAGRTGVAPAGPEPTGDHPAAPFFLISEEDRRRLPDGVEDAYPLTLLQGGMLFQNELAPESGFYQNVTAFRLRGPLEPDALRAAVRSMAARHPVLRTSFELHAYGEPLQLVHRTVDIPVTFADLRQLDAAARDAALAARFEEEKAHRFDPARAPLLRFHVDRVSDSEFELTLAEHHAILDGWSVAVLLSEIFRQYLFLLGRIESPLPSPPANGFRSYAALERETLASEETRRWWARALDSAEPSALPRWPSEARAGRAAEGRVRRLSLPLPGAVGEGLEAFARRAGVPFKSALLAAHLRVLSLLTGRPDVVSGLVSDGRPEEADPERTLGLFVNTLPFRLALTPGSWGDLARAVFAAERAMLPHRRFPLAEIQRGHGGTPLYEAVFNYVHFHVFQGIAGLSDVELLDMRAFQVTELLFVAELSRDSATSQLGLSLEYGRGHFDPAQIELFAGYYVRALGAMGADPEARHDANPLLTEAERHQILAEWNDSSTALPAALFVELFRARAEGATEATAVVFGARSLTYGELARRSETVARGLIAAGAAPDTLIALLAERSADFLTAIIGAFQAGAAYLPLDPHHPVDRLTRLLADSGAPLVVADRPRAALLAQAVAALPADRRPRLLVLEELIAGEPPARLPLPPVDGSRLAYAIYTSGSTGQPKGALVEQRGMVNHLWAKVLDLGLTADDTVAQTAPQGFDISVWQFLAALLVGGRVHVLPDEVAHDPRRLLEEVERSGLTVLETVPSLLRLLLEELERQPSRPAPGSLRWMIPTGEALPADLCRRWLRLCPGIPLLNAYGPTECSDDVTHHTLRDAPETDLAAMPIGRPVANLRLSVLGASLELLPVAVPGELHVSGAGVGRGYLGDGGRTAEVFVPDPFAGEPGGRLYRTGDLARLAPDGTIEFLGRVDHQVKIRGHRIELGEIEAALAGHPAVRAAVATVREDTPGEPRLVAYVVPSRPDVPEEAGAVQVGQWQTIFDEVYREGERSARDAAVNLRVWVSSYTGASLPEDEILESVEDSVQRILDLRPRRLLEIGCGTGLLLERIAPSCDFYCGTDISSEALQSLEQRLAGRRDLPPVELLQRAADDLHGLPEGGFDVVVLNEVAQYFPGAGYLARVLEGAAVAVAPGGALFVGGLRSLPLFEAFHTSVALHQAPAGASLDELRREARRRMAREKELLVDPELFPALAARVPRLGSVSIQLKGGRHHNELTKFRYDAVLRLDEEPAAGQDHAGEPPAAACSLAELRRSLEAGPASLTARGLPNARLLADLRAVERLREDRFATAGELREALETGAEAPGIDPADLWDLGRQLGYQVEAGWSAAGPDRIDVWFSRPGARPPVLPLRRTAPASWERFGNSPARSDDTAALVPELRDFLAGRLPEAMVPAAFVVLGELPLTPNGKLDRRALPAPEAAEPIREGSFAPPRTPAEEILAAIFADVLGRERLGIHDDFFELGGHSLLATRVISWARNTFQVELPLRALFEHPTVAGLAPVLDSALRSGGSAAAPPIRPAARRPGDDPPLSFAQQRLWFLDQLVPGNPFYNVPANVWVGGGFDVPSLAASLAEVVRRHEALRTSFLALEGRPVQRIAAELPVPLPVVDLRALSRDRAEREAGRLSRAEVRRPFDLARGPLLRASLVRVAEDQSLFLATLHHIVADGWSSGVLQRELAVLYQAFAAGRPSPLPGLPIQYADFAVWQRDWLRGQVLEQQLAYWRRRLADPPALDLPTDRPRPAIGSFRGNDRWQRLPRPLADGLRALGRRRGATLYMALLAVWNTLLHRYSGQTDLLVGTPIANRNRSEIEGLIGFFVNTLALRTDLAGAPSFLGLIDRTREVTLGAYAYQDLPFEKLVEEVHPDRDTSRNPLFQVVFVLQNFPAPLVALPGLSMRSFEVGHGTAKFDLTLFLAESELGLHAALEYSTDLFDAPTMDRMLGHFENLAAAALAHPGEAIGALPLLGEAERQQILREWAAGGAGPAPQETLYGLFATQAARTPGAPAATWEGETLTYGELDRRAGRLARRLADLGVGPEVPVALCLERSAALVVAVLGTLRAGGAYVPLDPAYPRERLAWLLADSRAAVLVSERSLASRLPETLPSLIFLDGEAPEDGPEAPPAAVASGNLAYVIYTSGSTGRPKGVQVTHANVVRLFTSTGPWFRFGAADVWTLFHSYAFDFSVWELWGALLHGGRLVVVPWEVSRSPEAFHALLHREGVTVLNQTPSAFRQLAGVDAGPGAPIPSLRLVVFGGEALDFRSLSPWLERHGDQRPLLVNMYGITETTIHVTYRPVAAAEAALPTLGSPVGVPIPDLQVRVLDSRLEPAPVGVPGEIHVSGAGLARGYLGRPELTAERFVPDPFAAEPGGRLYRTGDLARLRPGGELEHLGRIDQQVKVRGFRIEPGEIAATLAAHPAVRDAAVLLHAGPEDEAGGARLVAYVVPAPAAPEPEATGDSSSTEQVKRWQAVFDNTYDEPLAGGADPTFDITGWNSSYTGLPIPAEEMREWVEGTVRRILAERPTRVLEIGCGTGLLLFRLAPHAVVYRGTDFSTTVLEKLSRRLAGRGLDHVELEQRAADDFSGIEPGSFDAVVLSSVAQYFPGVDYLVRVIEGALRALAPGGFLFAGDLRSLPLLPAFHSAVELFQAGDPVPRAQLRHRVQRSLAREEELVLDPGLFPALAGRLGEEIQWDVQLRRGRHRNEMSRFRYDAVLRRLPDGEPPAGIERLSWDEAGLSFDELRRTLAETAPEEIEITGVPNARVAAEVAALPLLAAEAGPAHAGEMRRVVEESAAGAVDPEDLWELGEALSYEVAVGWSEAGADRMDVRLTRRRPDGRAARRSFPAAPAAAAPDLPWSAWANDPQAGRFVRSLVPRLRDHLQNRLPEHMVPAAFVLLDALPLTANGKLDRRALPAPDFARVDGRRGHAAPRGPVEETLAAIWSEVLGVERVGAHDGFFELGGHSLLATQVVARVRNAFAIELPLRALFEEPTVASLAARVEAALSAGEREQVPPLVPVPREGPLPLSFAQQRLWILDEIQPGRPEYNFPVPLRLSGPVDLAALAASLTGIVRRHEALRTTFDVAGGQPVQVVGPSLDLAAPLVDLGGLPESARHAELARLAVDEARRPFDLRRGPMFRATLLRLAAEEHALLLSLHHITADGWSLQVLIRDLAELYAAAIARRPPALPELPVQYADFAVWQRNWLEGDRLRRQLSWWRARLAGLPVLQLPTDRPRPAVQTSRGRHLAFSLPSLVSGALRELADREGATLFMALVAAFSALLRQVSGQDDLAVGTDVANRDRSETEGLIGFFVNQLVLRVDAAGDPTFRELLARVRETAIAAFSHQDLPFERLVAALQPDRDLSRTPLFQVKLVLQTTPADSGISPLPGVSLGVLNVENETAKFDLLFNLSETPAGLAGELEYNTDLFEEPTVARLIDRFRMLLHLAGERPDARLSELAATVSETEAAEREREFKLASRQRLRQVERRAVIGAAGG